MRKYRNCAEQAKAKEEAEKAKVLETITNINSDFRIQCITCGFTFNGENNLKEHVKQYHECKLTIRQSINLEKVETENDCVNCEKIFEKKK